MTSVGDTLRSERLKRKLELETISEELKLSLRFLQFIEADQFEKLPGGVFARSFVRQYAHLLGLDEDELTGQVERILAPDEPPLAGKPKPGGVVHIQVPKVDEWETVGDKRFHWSGVLSAVALLAVMLICSAVYAWLQRPKAAPAAIQARPVEAAPAQVVPPQAAPTPVVPTPEPTPAATTPAATEEKPAEVKPEEAKPAEQKPAETQPTPAAAPPAAPNPDATVHVEITADEQSWVSARADGKYLFSVTMDAHSTRMVEGVTDVVLKLGNAGGVSISLNGKPIGAAGPKGQVRTLQFTSGGFQIVPAKPASPPADSGSAPPAAEAPLPR